MPAQQVNQGEGPVVSSSPPTSAEPCTTATPSDAPTTSITAASNSTVHSMYRRRLWSLGSMCMVGIFSYRGTSTFWSRHTKLQGTLDYKTDADYSYYNLRDEEQQPTAVTAYGPLGALRWNWTHLPIQSQIAKEFYKHQTNCDLPLHYFPSRNAAGLGSDLHVYGMALCNAHRNGKRMFTPFPWMYVSHEDCDPIATSNSAMGCYFPKLELQCPGDEGRAMQVWNASRIMADVNPRLHRLIWETHEDMSCWSMLKRPGYEGLFNIMDVRSAITELVFSAVSPLLLKEAQRQHRKVFPKGAPPPHQLITVHIRWGDKGSEMRLQPVRKYIKAVQKVAQERRLLPHEVHIFLATEDPRAVQEFTQLSPKAWNIHVDQFMYDMLPHRNNRTMEVAGAAKRGMEKTGLWALGSLLVAMEADNYVLSTGSNWSRLMNELRKAVVRARKCPTPHHHSLKHHHGLWNNTRGDCTTFLDVQPSHSPYETGDNDPRQDKHSLILSKLKMLRANRGNGQGGVIGFGRHRIPTAPPRKWTEFNENAPRIKPDSLVHKEAHIRRVKYPRLQKRFPRRRRRLFNVR
ncbi:expressed unknown protein [Seminavis robusta]|uniref:Uncharacterized protein n=1 Tax=Seminavis robusta TaxID=568900 RepID=A0A9N8H8W6_9STRA|nr:expressed unknown protein [Seminavis robusta]|eukprot:Sro172_g075920.1 n/a (573) ;mRNA; r:19499-21217